METEVKVIKQILICGDRRPL